MAIHMRWLDKNEVAYGMSCIEQLWKSNHILARDRALFEWQYRHGKTTETLGFLVAENEGKPVGFYGAIFLPCHCYGLIFPGMIGSIIVVESRYRGRLGLLLLRQNNFNVSFHISIGDNDRTIKLHNTIGNYTITPYPRYVCLVNDSLLKEYLKISKNTENISPSRFNACSKFSSLKKISRNNIEILSKDNLNSWESAWEKLFAPKLIGIVKNIDYIRWRYLEHPTWKYELRIVRNNLNEVQGLVVFRIIKLTKDIYFLRILEFLASNEKYGSILASTISDSVTDNILFIEHIALGKQWKALRTIGLDLKGNELFSTWSNPPDMLHCKLSGSCMVAPKGYTMKSFVTSPDMYFTVADGDQDRPS